MLRYVPLIGIKEPRPIHMKPIDFALVCKDRTSPCREQRGFTGVGQGRSREANEMFSSASIS